MRDIQKHAEMIMKSLGGGQDSAAMPRTALPGAIAVATNGLSSLGRALLFRPPDPFRDPYYSMQVANAWVPRGWLRGNLCAIGSTGSGKTTVLQMLLRSILENLPEHVGVCNVWSFDIMNDLIDAFRAMDTGMEIVEANPFSAAGQAWDLQRDLTIPAHAPQFAASFFQDQLSKSKGGGGGENEFFVISSMLRLAAVMRELVNLRRSRRVPWSLRQAFLVSLDPEYCRQLIRQSDDATCRMVLGLLSKDLGQTGPGLDASMVRGLGQLATTIALLENCRGRFSLRELIREDIIFVAGGDPDFTAALEPYYALMLTVLKSLLLAQPQQGINGEAERLHLLPIDEYTGLMGDRPAKETLDLLVRGRARGVRTILGFHTPEQLAALYGPHDAMTILGACQSKLIFKVNDPAGADTCSKMLGHVYGHEWTRNVNVTETMSMKDCSISFATGASEQRVDSPIVHRDEIMGLPLGSFEGGIHGRAILSTDREMCKWRYRLGPEFLRRYALTPPSSEVAYYRSRRMDPELQRLRPLARDEVERFGLTYIEPR